MSLCVSLPTAAVLIPLSPCAHFSALRRRSVYPLSHYCNCLSVPIFPPSRFAFTLSFIIQAAQQQPAVVLKRVRRLPTTEKIWVGPLYYSMWKDLLWTFTMSGRLRRPYAKLCCTYLYRPASRKSLQRETTRLIARWPTFKMWRSSSAWWASLWGRRHKNKRSRERRDVRHMYGTEIDGKRKRNDRGGDERLCYSCCSRSPLLVFKESEANGIFPQNKAGIR